MAEPIRWAPAALWLSALFLGVMFVTSMTGNGAWLRGPALAVIVTAAVLLLGLAAYAAFHVGGQAQGGPGESRFG